MKTYKYLGLYIHSTKSWTSAKSDITTRASRAICILIANLKRFWPMPIPILVRLFDTKIVPILTYGAELRGLSGVDDIEKIADNFYRRLLGLRKTASSTFVRGELGRRSILRNIFVKVVSFWTKLVPSPVSKSTFKCYQYQLYLSHTNRPCWATDVKKFRLW